MDAHPDLAAEQRYLDHAYDCLAAMRAQARGTVEVAERAARQEGGPDADIVLWHLERRLAALAETPAALCFGRLDDEEGERFYVGRRHVEDRSGDPVVVDWRARASTPFYRATFADPMGLERRRRFMVEGQRLVDLADEDFDDPDAAGLGGGVPDPLLAELERARTGQMRDIVATIQAEQDEVIRAPLDDLVIVQGGPGTGKTAVGLHRAAFLLYEHREMLERRRVLVIGPNRVFLRYIAQVLPSLGETAVVQATIESLMAGRYPVRRKEASAVARLKGDPRLAAVLRGAVRRRITPPSSDLDITTGFGRVRLAGADVAALIEAGTARPLPSNDGRDVLRQQLAALAWRTWRDGRGADPSAEVAFGDDLRRSRDFKAALDRLWPSLSAPALVRQLLGNKRVLADAGSGLLDAGEQALLWRRPAGRVREEQWARGDLALLDEAEALTSGTPVTYGHVVVDEAQDLSAMELRLLARRCPERSMTVLGDLAQATAVWSQERWDDALAHLDAPRGRVVELELGYRVPAAILDYANRLLPEVAPHVRPSRSVRAAGDPPYVITVARAGLPHAAVAEVQALAGRWATVGVIAPRSLIDDVGAALRSADLPYADGRRGQLGDGVTLLPPTAAKGLEFDAVVLVEPGRIVDEEPNGARLLYVGLTRAVQHLGIVHADALPAALR